MKVMLLNGSPHPAGCTYTALAEAESVLGQHGIGTAWTHIGNKPILGCQGCGACYTLDHCAFENDADNLVNRFVRDMAGCDALIIGSPVYYAGPNGALCALLDRAFYSGGDAFRGKPGAAVASCRRGGATATLDRLNKYLTICQMPVVSSQYWNMVHGNTPDEVRQDAEGLQTMRTLGHSLAWMLKAIAAGGPLPPAAEKPQRTNFIR